MKLAEQKDVRLSRNELLLNALQYCDYELYLDKWRQAVGAERIMVYIFEDIKKNTRAFMKDIASKLGIDAGFYDEYGFPLENYSYKLKSYKLHQVNIKIRKLLPIPQRSGLWRALRSVYRKVNTQPHDKTMPAADREAFNLLNEHWATRYSSLVCRYGLFPQAEKGAATAVRVGGDLSFSR